MNKKYLVFVFIGTYNESKILYVATIVASLVLIIIIPVLRTGISSFGITFNPR